jgi:hypothetical protein
MNLSLTDIVVVPHLSEETTCFQAIVQVDGSPSFIASNRGQGACNDYRPYGSSPECKRLLEKAQAWALTLPPITYKAGRATITVPSDLDCVIDRLLQQAS